MEQLPAKNQLEEFAIYVIPVYTLSGVKMIYEFPEAFYYGVFLIFCDNKPKFYFFAADKKYESFTSLALEKGITIDKLLQNLFKSKGLNLTMHHSYLGIVARRKEELKVFQLEELPLCIFEE